MYITTEGKCIDEGLFCKVDIPPNAHFIAFDGIYRTMEEFKIIRKKGKGRYALYATKHTVVDCYDKCMNGKCMASKSNNSLNLFHSVTQTPAVANASLKYDSILKTADLSPEIKG